MRKYDVVLFDLDGTLRTDQPDGIEAFIEFASQIGVSLSPDQMRHLMREVHRYWANGVLVDQHLARHDERGFWINYYGRLLDAIGIDNCDGCGVKIHALFKANHDPDDMLFADTWPVLRALREAGHVVGLVTNRDQPVGDYLARIGIAPLFDFSLTGGQAQSYKPDAAIFHAALRLAGGAPADRALFVGDNFYADIVGARNVGMDAVLIDRRGIFAEDYDCCVRHLREVLGVAGLGGDGE